MAVSSGDMSGFAADALYSGETPYYQPLTERNQDPSAFAPEALVYNRNGSYFEGNIQFPLNPPSNVTIKKYRNILSQANSLVNPISQSQAANL